MRHLPRMLVKIHSGEKLLILRLNLRRDWLIWKDVGKTAFSRL